MDEANTYEHYITPNTKWNQVQKLLGDGGWAANSDSRGAFQIEAEDIGKARTNNI
jgi:hypothetical protein